MLHEHVHPTRAVFLTRITPLSPTQTKGRGGECHGTRTTARHCGRHLVGRKRRRLLGAATLLAPPNTLKHPTEGISPRGRAVNA